MNFRDKKLADAAGKKIAKLAGKKKIRLMHVCGTHEDTITKFGIRGLLPENLEVLSGPGCPVCVTPAKEIDEAIKLAETGNVITTFGDMLKVPGSRGCLSDAKADGCDVRVVYSISDSLKMAMSSKGEVTHIGIGFETTAPTTAAALLQGPPENFSVLSCHRLVPPALEALLSSGEVKIDGFIQPGHISTIIGAKVYEPVSEKFKIPQVIAGFEPLDVLFGIITLLEMLDKGECGVKNEYSRVVHYEGNKKAQAAMGECFDIVDTKWRGFPKIPKSGLELNEKFEGFDARKKFNLKVKDSADMPAGCRCADVLKGLIYPNECPLFGKICKPDEPVGPCMVSAEGSCAIWYKYKR